MPGVHAFLEAPWTLKAHGEAVSTMSRAGMIADTFVHSAHHRGQLTVYLRLLGDNGPGVVWPLGRRPALHAGQARAKEIARAI